MRVPILSELRIKGGVLENKIIESELGTAQREHPAEMGTIYDPPRVPKGPSDWL